MNNRIKMVRKNSGMTQAEFGNALGIKQNTVAVYESGIREPSSAVITLICREFKVSESWLRTGSGEMYTFAEKNDDLSWITERLTPDAAEAARKITRILWDAVDDTTADKLLDALKTAVTQSQEIQAEEKDGE